MTRTTSAMMDDSTKNGWQVPALERVVAQIVIASTSYPSRPPCRLPYVRLVHREERDLRNYFGSVWDKYGQGRRVRGKQRTAHV
jgi:hypothetical protein